MRFFERFRLELKRYADGVHELRPAATDGEVRAAEQRIGRALPEAYRDFLLQWNGGYLFHDDYAVYGTDGIAVADAELEIGRAPAGAVRLDRAGRVVAIDDATAARAVEGSDFARWIEAVMVREGLVYDREGEFREEAFDGVELTAKVHRRRAEAAVKVDPASPAWREELGKLLADAGRVAEAAEALARAVELEPRAASAWFALGKLRREVGALEPAALAFRRCGEAEREPEEAAFAFAHAARCARAVGLPGDELAALAAAAHPSFVEEQRAGAEHLLVAGDAAGALERLGLAAAVAPADEAVQQALARARARGQLKPL